MHEDRIISLADYRGKTPLLLGLFRGLYCPFCRRALAQMATSSDRLKSSVSIALPSSAPTSIMRALYFKFRPTRMALGADPSLSDPSLVRRATARSLRPDLMQAIAQYSHQPDWRAPCASCQCPPPVPLSTRSDGFQPTPADQRDMESTFTQLKGQFLIDRDGVVQWAHIECQDGLSGLSKFPSHDELIDAASRVIGVLRGVGI